MNLPLPPPVERKLQELKELEVALGNLPSESLTINELSKRALDQEFATNAKQMSLLSEKIFQEICADLSESGYSALQIVTVINSQLNFPGGLKYCNENEVNTAIET